MCLNHGAWDSDLLAGGLWGTGVKPKTGICWGSGLLSVSWFSRQVRLPPGGGAEDARGLFWVLDEEVRVEGSSDSVVLERLCAAFEKKGAEAEGKGDGGGGRRVQPGVGVCPCLLQKAPRRSLPGRGLCAEPSPCAVSFTHSRARVFRRPHMCWAACCAVVSQPWFQMRSLRQ